MSGLTVRPAIFKNIPLHLTVIQRTVRVAPPASQTSLTQTHKFAPKTSHSWNICMDVNYTQKDAIKHNFCVPN